jgi:hypothetical protein
MSRSGPADCPVGRLPPTVTSSTAFALLVLGPFDSGTNFLIGLLQLNFGLVVCRGGNTTHLPPTALSWGWLFCAPDDVNAFEPPPFLWKHQLPSDVRLHRWLHSQPRVGVVALVRSPLAQIAGWLKAPYFLSINRVHGYQNILAVKPPLGPLAARAALPDLEKRNATPYYVCHVGAVHIHRAPGSRHHSSWDWVYQFSKDVPCSSGFSGLWNDYVRGYEDLRRELDHAVEPSAGWLNTPGRDHVPSVLRADLDSKTHIFRILKYESLVLNPEGETSRLARVLGLRRATSVFHTIDSSAKPDGRSHGWRDAIAAILNHSAYHWFLPEERHVLCSGLDLELMEHLHLSAPPVDKRASVSYSSDCG